MAIGGIWDNFYKLVYLLSQTTRSGMSQEPLASTLETYW